MTSLESTPNTKMKIPPNIQSAIYEIFGDIDPSYDFGSPKDPIAPNIILGLLISGTWRQLDDFQNRQIFTPISAVNEAFEWIYAYVRNNEIRFQHTDFGNENERLLYEFTISRFQGEKSVPNQNKITSNTVKTIVTGKGGNGPIGESIQIETETYGSRPIKK